MWLLKLIGEIAAVALLIYLALMLFYFVHVGLDGISLRHARMYCRKKGLTISRLRMGPEFDRSGTKTESSIVEFDCVDPNQQRRFVRLLVWPFGLRKVLKDEEWNSEFEDLKQ